MMHLLLRVVTKWSTIAGIFVLTMTPQITLAQNASIDSLKAIVQTGKQDTTMVVALNALSSELIQTEELEEAKAYADQAIALANQLDFKKGKAYALKNIGIAEYYQSNYKEVLNYWTQSLQTFEAIQDTLGIANLALNLGVVFYDQGSHARALDYYLQSLSFSEKLGDPVRITSALVNIGSVYTELNDYDKAINYYEQVEPYLATLKNIQLQSAYLWGLGEVYSKKGDHENALKYYNEALVINKNTSDYAHILTAIGKEERQIGNVQKAIEYFDLAFKTAEDSDLPLDQVRTLLALGNTYKESDPKKALQVYKTAENLAMEIETDEELRDIYQGMALAYDAAGNYKNAYAYQNKYLDLKDKIFNIETDDKIRGLQFDFDLDKKEDEIGLLEKEAEITQLLAKRQQYVIYGTVLGLLLVFVLAVGSYKRYRYVKKTNKIIEEEKNRSENLLLNILPDETALELKQFGKVKAKKFESVTVMFTDFKGFTSYSQNLSPELLVKTVDYYFSKFDAIMEKYDLEKIKTIGDAYMCAGGLPFPTKDHPYKMVQAAFEIAQVMEETRLKPPKDIVPFDVRIGINTGVIIAGVVGTRKFAYDIWGDTVNVAARMESLSEPGRVNVSQSTYLLIRDRYNCEHRGQIHVKNKGMMDMYYVNEKKDEPSIKAKKENIINI
ncbi:adenylate/guanylate cyclase domain-containing protein [uncultured Eudoraea sp.]|uniref:adenylate/guanylate cyclase domain-containing protein n=1 Tax=uncultured Eudoraea sp. TaxID=1035614 RepID=UPI00262A02E4|nr:adenylate/guanylate cyclase domain-containing protein [uncultured Eudoraea sp.]